MTITVTEGKPFVFGPDAKVTISDIELNCVVQHLDLIVETTTVTSTSLCTAIDHPGTSKWTFGGTLYQSFQDNGAFDVMSAAAFNRVPVPFTVSFHAGSPSANNPQFSGMAIPRPVNIVASDAGALVECAFVWGVDGEPEEDYGSGPQKLGTHGDSIVNPGAPLARTTAPLASTATPAA